MIAYTNANTANLPTTPAPAAPKSWDKKDRAIAAAVKALGPEARNEFEFTVEKCDGRWMWRATDADKIPPPNAAQFKANGGKRGFAPSLPTRDALAVELLGTPAEKLALEITQRKDEKAGEAVANAAVEKIMAAAKKPVKDETISLGLLGPVPALDATEDENGRPAFLKREGDNSVETQKARVEKYKKTTGPDRQIKNPPNIKAAKTKSAKGKRAGGKGQTKTALVGQLLLRKEGCTTADIINATGWPTVSVPAQAKAVGLGLRKEKDGKVMRYFGVPTK
jgi:hypothetical protein